MRDARQAAGRIPEPPPRSARRHRRRPHPGCLPLTAAPIAASNFAAWLDPLGPFEPNPRLSVAVSGGADSMALALLSRDWVVGRGGSLLALVVDHGFRADSAAEAARTRHRLDALGIPARILTLRDLRPRAESARTARYAALEAACRAAGIVHLLLGHHASDQAETVMMRLLRGSGADGLAAMPALVETHWLRLLRPLLRATPGALRATLRAAGIGWEEDPSNRDFRALRTRLRQALGDPDGAGPQITAHCSRATAQGLARREREAMDAAWFGRYARLHPERFAILLAPPERASPLRALIRAVGGATHPPTARAANAWLAAPRAATLGGVVLRPAGRLAPGGWLLAREATATAPPAPARAIGARIGGGGRARDLPAVIRRGLAVVEGDPAPATCWWPAPALAGAGFVPA